MSSVDQRVVDMQFNNAQFEKGVGNSLKSLDSLKKGLDLDKSAKSLDNLQRAGKKFSLNGLADNVQYVANKFSALGILGVTAMQRISNAAITTGKKVVSALTIDPLKDGLREYETQINAIQTILSNTRSKGTTIDDVNKALDDLNAYSDKTIYNFTEMAKNIGTFTAAGIDLDKSTSSIKGIANLAAVSGSTSQQAATAMYQLSQALSSGTVRLMDWNSVVNAGMGGEVFQNSLMETARIHGVEIDKILKKEGSFRETLQTGWMTSEILLETLNKFTGDLSKEQILSMGYTEKQAEEILALGKDASDAATKIKTFTQLIDTLKEALGSGWAQSWENIIGNFDEARTLWTGISDSISGIINQQSKDRNDLLSGWKEAGGRTALIQGLTDTFSALWSVVLSVTDAMKSVFPDVTVDNLLGISTSVKEFGANLKKVLNYREELVGSKKITEIGDPTGLKKFNGELKNGMSGSEIKEMQAQLDSLGYLVDGIDGKFGPKTEAALKSFQKDKGLLINGIFGESENNSLFGTSSEKKVWYEGEYVNVFSDNLERLKRIASGVFAVFDIGGKYLGFVGKIFGHVGKLLAPLGDALLTIGAAMGDSVVEFNDWLDTSGTLSESFDKVVAFLKPFGEWIKVISNELLKFFGLLEGDEAEEGGTTFSSIFDSIKSSITAGWESLSSIFTKLTEMAKTIGVGGFVGILIGILGVVSIVKIIKSITSIGGAIKKVAEIIQNPLASLKPSKLQTTALSFLVLAASIGIVAGAIYMMGQMSGQQIANGLIGLAGAMALMIGFKFAMDKIGSGKVKIASLLSISLAVGILAFIIGQFGNMRPDTLRQGFIGLVGAMAAMIAFKWAMGALQKSADIQETELFSIAVVLEAMVRVVKLIGEMKPEELAQGFIGLTGVMLLVMAFKWAVAKVGKVKFNLVGLIKIAAAIVILALVVKLMGDIPMAQMAQGLLGLTAIMTLLVAFKWGLKRFGSSKANFQGLFGIALAIGVLAVIVKLLGSMDPMQLLQGILGLTGILSLLVAFKWALKKFGSSKVEFKGLFSMALAIGVLSLVVRSLGEMPIGSMMQGILGLTAVLTLLVSFKWALNKFGSSKVEFKGLFGITIAIALLAGVTYTLGQMKPESLQQGILGLIAIMGLLVILKKAMSLMGNAPVKTKGILAMIKSLWFMITAMAVIVVGLSALMFVFAEVMQKVKNIDPLVMIGFATSLSIMIFALIGALALAGTVSVPVLVMGAVGIVAGITILVGAAVAIVASLGALNSGGGLVKKLESGAQVLRAVGRAIGGFVGGIKEGLLGLTNLEDYSNNVESYGTSLGKFAKSTSGITKESVEGAVNASNLLSSFVDGLPKMGGAISYWEGDQDFEQFALDLESFAGALASFVASVKGMSTEESLDTDITEALATARRVSNFFTGLVQYTLNTEGINGYTTAAASLSTDMTLFGNAISAFTTGISGLGDSTTIDADTDTALEIAKKVHGFFSSLVSYMIDSTVLPRYNTAASQLSTDMTSFANAISAFTTGVSGLGDSETVTSDTDTAIAIATKVHGFFISLADQIIDQSNLLTYNSAATDLSTNMGAFATAIDDFKTKISGIAKTSLTKDTDTAVTNAQKVQDFIVGIKAVDIETDKEKVAEFAKNSLFSDIGTFGESMGKFIEGVSNAAKSGLDKNTPKAIEAAKSIETFLEDLVGIDIEKNRGVLVKWVAGDNTTGSLFSYILQFGKSIGEFRTSVSGLDKEAIDKDVQSAVDSATAISDFLEDLRLLEIEKDKNVIDAWVTGDTKTNTLFSKMIQIGESIKTSTSSFSGISTGTFTADVLTAKLAIKEMVGLLVWMANDENRLTNLYNIYDFDSALPEIGDSIQTFADNIKGVDTTNLASVVYSVKTVMDAFVLMAGSVTAETISTFKTSLVDLSNMLTGEGEGTPKLDSSKFLENLDADTIFATLETFTNTINGAISGSTEAISGQVTAFTTQGAALGTAITDGIGSTSTDTTGVSTLLTSAITASGDYVDDFKTAGYNLGVGLRDGLKSSTEIAKTAARALAKAMLDAAKKALGIASPSKEFEYIGENSVQSLANSLRSNSRVANKAGFEVGSSVLNSTQKVLADLYTIVDDNLDSTPVIRPVIDLSNITSGSKTISSMLSRGQTISLDSTKSRVLASSIDFGSNSRTNQNGSVTTGSNGVNPTIDSNGVSVTGNFYIRSDNDIKLLAHEIRALQTQQQRSLGATPS